MADTPDPFDAPFGTLFGDSFTTATYDGEAYRYSGSAEPVTNFSFHPATHVLHYGSAIFEGLKAHKQVNGSVAIFRLDDHVARLRQSAARLRLPVPDTDMLRQMIVDATRANLASCPDAPGSLYLRPTLIGTEQNIGAAASPSATALLYILTSPVGDYFKGGIRPLRLLIETDTPRTTPQFGMVKTGANYAMALDVTLKAKAAHDVDQVLFATAGEITETGAANFFLVDDNKVITRNLDESFLHGVTRASLVQLAHDLGYEVEERELDVDELLAWAAAGEVFLSGTAAVVSPVGTLIHGGQEITVGDGQPGKNTLRLREALTSIQLGAADDPHGWRTPVGA